MVTQAQEKQHINYSERRCTYNGKQMWWRHQEERFRHEEEVTCIIRRYKRIIPGQG